MLLQLYGLSTRPNTLEISSQCLSNDSLSNNDTSSQNISLSHYNHLVHLGIISPHQNKHPSSKQFVTQIYKLAIQFPPTIIWAAPSEFGTYRICEQRRFRRACASAQSRQNLRCSLIQAVSQEEPSDRKPDPWPL